jgi:hypothetical protein
LSIAAWMVAHGAAGLLQELASSPLVETYQLPAAIERTALGTKNSPVSRAVINAKRKRIDFRSILPSKIETREKA